MKPLIIGTLLLGACADDSSGLLQQPAHAPRTCVVSRPLTSTGLTAYGTPMLATFGDVTWLMSRGEALRIVRWDADREDELLLDGAYAFGESFIAASTTTAALVWRRRDLSVRFLDLADADLGLEAPFVALAIPDGERLTHFVPRGDGFMLATMRDDDEAAFAYRLDAAGAITERRAIDPLPLALVADGDGFLGVTSDSGDSELLSFHADLTATNRRPLGVSLSAATRILPGPRDWLVASGFGSKAQLIIVGDHVNVHTLAEAPDGRAVVNVQAAPFEDLVAFTWVEVGPGGPNLAASDAVMRFVLIEPQTLAVRSNVLVFDTQPELRFALPVARGDTLELIGATGFHAGGLGARATVRCD